MNDLLKQTNGLTYQDQARFQSEMIQHEAVWLMNFHSPQTKRSYLKTCRAFIDFHHLKDFSDLRAVTPLEIIQYRDYLLNDLKQSHRSVKNRLSALSSLFKYLVENQILAVNPVQSVKRPKVASDRGETPAMTESQAKKLLSLPDISTLSGLRDSAILHTLFYTGCRVSGISSMEISSLYEDMGYSMLKYTNKGGDTQHIEVHQELQLILNNYIDMSGHGHDQKSPLFLPLKKNKETSVSPLTSRQISRVFGKYRKLAGLKGAFTPHSTRSTSATLALENGASLEDVQRMLGHSRITTTQGYDKRVTHHKNAASLRLHY